MAERTAFAFPAAEPAIPLTANGRSTLLGNPTPARLPMNIVIAIHTPRDEKTAVYKSTVRRARYLEALGHNCRILTPDDFPILRRTNARFFPLLYPLVLAHWLAHHRDVNLALFHSYAGWVVTLIQKSLGLMRGLRTGIVFHGLEPVYYARLEQQAELSGCKLSWRYRLLHGHIMQRLIRMSTRAADIVFCLNQDEQHYLLENNWAKPSRVKVLANPAPEHFFIERNHRERASILLFVGQWLPMKGIQYLVESFTALHLEYPYLRLCCAGTMAGEAEVLSSFSADVRHAVSVFPRVTENELLALHREADIFVFPSLSEGFSLALSEAMASGLPIVATTVGAAPDLLVHDRSALLVPPHVTGLLKHALCRLTNDRTLRVRLGANARSAAEQLRLDKVMNDFEVCFQLLVPKRESGDNGLQGPVLVNEGF